jgi:Tol biopolymer transport system component
MRRGWILLLGLLASIAVAALALITGAPRLVEVDPAPGAGSIPTGAALHLAFTRPMEPGSVADHLRLQPDRTGQMEADGAAVRFTPDQPWPAGTTVTVTLESGAQPQGLGLPLLSGQTWSFTIRQVALAYLWPSDAPADVYALDPASGEITRLTRSTRGVLDYQVSLSGAQIAYSAANLAGGSDVFLLERASGQARRLLDCGPIRCTLPRLSPDRTGLAYQLEPPGGGAEIHLLALVEGGTGQDEQVAAFSRPSDVLDWSPGGVLLFHDMEQGVFVLYQPGEAARESFSNDTGQPGDWSPSGETYVAPKILLAETAGTDRQTIPSHLVRYDLEPGLLTDLTRQLVTEDLDPAFSPDGETLAFARRYLDQSRWTPGRQLWLMGADGSNPRPLTNEPAFTHTDMAWRRDGSQLAYVRFNQVTLTDPPEIWMINADGSDPLRLVIGGYDPQWLP